MGADAHLRAALHLATVGGFGPASYGALMALGGAQDMLDASEDVVRPRLGTTAQFAAWMAARTAVQRQEDHKIAGSLALAKKHGVWLRGDPGYPTALDELSDAPIVLFHQGEHVSHALSQPCVAIVGTRAPDAYGRRVAGKLAHQLAKKGMTVVSGAAEGIDTCAHQSALGAGGATVAVLGVPLSSTHALENCPPELMNAGGVVSERLPEVEQHRGAFPARNRIISGLCKVTIVVQGGATSGTGHTALYARAQKRILMAVPGEVDNDNSTMPHRLLAEGAQAVFRIRDVLAHYGIHEPDPPAAEADAGDGHPAQKGTLSLPLAPPTPNLTPQQAQLLGALGRAGSVGVEQVVETSGLPPAHVNRMLLELELMGLCRRAPGGAYARV